MVQILCEITAKYFISDDDEVQDFLGRLFEREVEKAVKKAWKKVFSEDALEELQEKTKGEIPNFDPPAIFFARAGSTERVSTEESDGRNTAVGAPDPFDDEDED